METIEKGRYEGWLWYSNQDKPYIISADEERPFSFDDNENPFVVEGQLWSEDTGTSYSIKYVDGKYIVVTHLVSQEDLKDEKRVKKFVANKEMTGVKFIKMLPYWKAESDPLCEGFEALMPDKLVFVGFDKDKKEE